MEHQVVVAVAINIFDVAVVLRLSPSQPKDHRRHVDRGGVEVLVGEDSYGDNPFAFRIDGIGVAARFDIDGYGYYRDRQLVKQIFGIKKGISLGGLCSLS